MANMVNGLTMNSEFYNVLLALGGALSLLGLLYLIFGFFCIGPDFSGAMLVLRGGAGRLFGLAYMLLGLPVLAYAYGATRMPDLAWYQWLKPHIHSGNFLFWFGGWLVFVLTLHVISFFVKDMRGEL